MDHSFVFTRWRPRVFSSNNIWFFGLTRVCSPGTASLSVPPFFAELTVLTNRQTDRQTDGQTAHATCDIRSNSPHLQHRPNSRGSNQILLGDKDQQRVFVVSCSLESKFAIYVCFVLKLRAGCHFQHSTETWSSPSFRCSASTRATDIHEFRSVFGHSQNLTCDPSQIIFVFSEAPCSAKNDVLNIYRVVQKNEATLHFPKYLENY